MSKRPTAERPTLGRGVWLAPYTLNGRPVLIAVDSKGELVRTVRVTSENVERDSVSVRQLETLLNMIDGGAR